MFRRTPFRPYPILGLWLVFFVNGAVLSSWAPRIPEVAHRLALSDPALGTALFGVAAGSLPALFLTGRLLRRVGDRAVCLLSATLFAAGLPEVAGATGPAALALVLAALGAASGALDVAMNTAGIEYQRRRAGAPVIARLHGGYSLGVLCGAAGGAAATAVGIPVAMHFVVVATVLLALLAIAGPHVPRSSSARAAGPEELHDGPSGTVVALAPAARAVTPAVAAVAVAGLLLEGVLTDWSALLVARDRGAGAAVGATVVVAFSLAMFVSRSAGDWVIPRLGRLRYLLLAALVGGAGTSVGLVAPGWLATYAGVVAVGLVVGPVFPLAIDLGAERAPGSVASATAAVSAVGYLAHLGGPPLVGMLAQSLGLPRAVALLGAVAGVALAGGAFLHTRPRRPPVGAADMRHDRGGAVRVVHPQPQRDEATEETMKARWILLPLLGAAGTAVGRARTLRGVASGLRHPAAPLIPSMGPVGLKVARAMPTPSGVPTGGGVDVRRHDIDGGQDVYVYTPTTPNGGALLWIHGGGTVIGAPEVDHRRCVRMARDTGTVVVSTRYRLAPEHPFPAGHDDCYAALRWLHDGAAARGIDASRIGVGGASAGGGLAAGVVQRAVDEGLPVAFQLLVYPMLDDRTPVRPADHRGALVWTRRSNAFAWDAYLGAGHAERDVPAYAAPARRSGLTGLPPAWIGVGDLDLFHDEDVDYARRLEAAGVPVDLLVEPGMYHAADLLAPRATPIRAFNRSAIGALRRGLAPRD
ncbi:MFS transporter [Tsukamurella ocularis]|uniref:MFS transporter n=1 Tax=Tsukamurella ocularis TaxID=1970234 RepID=UPI0039F0AC9F